MAVTTCVEVANGRSYSESPTGARNYTRIFEVDTDDPMDGPVIVRAASCLPDRGDPYDNGQPGESDSEALCIGVTSMGPRNDDPHLWTVIVAYSTEYPTNPLTCDYQADDPTDAGRISVERDYRIWEKYSNEDLDGDAFVNTAGDPLLNPPPMFVTNTIFRVTKGFLLWDDADSESINNSVNSVAWLDFPQYSIKCHSAKWERLCENGVNFSRVTFELEYNPELWYPTYVISTGFREINSISGEPKSVTDEFGNNTQNPVLLAVDGSETDTPYEISFKTVRLVDIGTIIGLLPIGSLS